MESAFNRHCNKITVRRRSGADLTSDLWLCRYGDGDGDGYDNALAETINGLYKAEVIHRRSWPTRESVELATLEWVSWLNNHRLLGPIGYVPPAEAEANDYRQLASQTATVAA